MDPVKPVRAASLLDPSVIARAREAVTRWDPYEQAPYYPVTLTEVESLLRAAVEAAQLLD